MKAEFLNVNPWGTMGQIPFRSLVSSQSSHDKVKDMIACVLKCKRGGEKRVHAHGGQTGGPYVSEDRGSEGGGSSGAERSSKGRQGSRGGGESEGEESRAVDADVDADALAEALSSDCYLVSTVRCPFHTPS